VNFGKLQAVYVLMLCFDFIYILFVTLFTNAFWIQLLLKYCFDLIFLSKHCKILVEN